MARRPARRSARFRAAASALVLVLMFGALEALARVAGPEAPVWRPTSTGMVMTGNPTRLWGLTEGTCQNGSVTATVNALGLRGPMPELPRPEGRQRVLLVGDSSYFGHAIADSATIGARLEATLRADGIDVDVVNGAIPGYSTEQTRILLDEVGWSVQPTLLLIANLWSDNNADGFQDVDLLRTARVYQNNPLAGSALFRVVAGVVDRARGGSSGHLITWTKSSTWPEARARRVPIQDYARNLDAMVRDARERGAGAAFISPANQGLVNGAYQSGAGWDPYFAAQAAVAAWHGLPVASAVEALQADPASIDEKFVDQMHPSARGAEDIARTVAGVLRNAGWPATPLTGRADAFDASALVDDARVPPGGQDRKFSPQAQLFPGMAEDAGNSEPSADRPDGAPPSAPMPGPGDARPPGNDAPDAPAIPAAPASPDAPVPPGSAGTTTRVPVDGGFDVTGQITGGTAPIRVTVLSADGRPVAFTSADADGRFSLHVGADHDAVTVTAADASGAQRSAAASRAAPTIRLSY